MDQPFYIVGGNLNPDAPSYIERRADRQLLAGLLAGEFCYVLDTRQIGKSSLMGRAMARLQEQGVRVVDLDLARIGQSLSVEQWYYGLLVDIGGHLGLREPLRAFWQQNKDLGPMQRWLEAIREIVLPAQTPEYAPQDDDSLPSPPPTNKPRLVIFVDEIENVLNLPFSTDEFFAGIRECYTRRIHDPLMRELTFCLIGSTTPDNLIRDARTTPFNIGRAIEMNDFTPSEAAPLAKGMSSGGRDGHKLLSRVLYWTNGHPYLTQRFCQAVAEEETVRSRSGVDRLCEELFFAPGRQEKETNLSFVGSRILKTEIDLASLLETYALIRRHRLVRDDPANPFCTVLRLSGVVRAVTGYLWVRNRIYHRVFDRAWVQANMPGAERRRQQAAYRKGMVRATAFSGLGLALIGSLALAAFRAERRAQSSEHALIQERDNARHLLYAADMSAAQQALEQQHNVTQTAELLNEHRNDRWRGFAWRYLWREFHRALFSCSTDQNGTYAVAYSPDGKLLATADAGGAVRLWNASDGKPVRVFQPNPPVTPGHAFSLDGYRFYPNHQEVNALAFSPDGRRLATTGWGPAICISDVATGHRLRTLLTRAPMLRTVAFSPDGRELAAGGFDKVVSLWDATTGKQLGVLSGCTERINSVAFSPGGRLLASASGDGSVRIWDLATRHRIKLLTGRADEVTCVVFSPDGHWLAAGDSNGVVRIWDAATWQIRHSIDARANFIKSVAFSPDSRCLAIGSQGNAIFLYDVPSGEKMDTLEGHTGAVASVAFSPNYKRLATAGFDGSTKVWNITTKPDKTVLEAYQQQDVGNGNIEFSADGTRLAALCTDNTTIFIWNAATGRLMIRFRIAQPPATSLTFTPDGRELAVGGIGELLGYYDIATGHLIKIQKAHVPGIYNNLACSPDGHTIAMGTRDGFLYLWDFAGSGEMRLLKKYPSRIDALEFSPDGSRLAVGPHKAPLEIGTISTGWHILPFRADCHRADCIAFSPDGKEMVTGGDDRIARLWDVGTEYGRNSSVCREILNLSASNASIRVMHFTENSNTILMMDRNGELHTWRAATKDEIAVQALLAASSSASSSP